MLLYWGMFTIGFSIGAILSFITFAPKKPEEEYENLPEVKQPTTFILTTKNHAQANLTNKPKEKISSFDIPASN